MKKTSILFLIALGLSFGILSCKKNERKPDPIGTGDTQNPNGGQNDIVSHKRNLDIVYFIPNDLDTLPGWKNRLGDIMTYAQHWYGDQMKTAGYGYKTFGLTKDSETQKAKIILIKGTKPKASYGTSSNTYNTEIDAYFAANPGSKTSKHTLILVPAFGYDNNSKEGPQPLEGVQPFFGNGTNCFAMDNVYMDMKFKGVLNEGRNNFAKWVGGLMHELGHAFNAPHDKQKVSQNIWPGANYKEPIMALSNFYLEVRPCFITDATAAIFDRCEVFNTDAVNYYESVTTSIPKIHAGYNATSGNIEVAGKYTSSGTVSKIAYFFDPNVNNEGTGTNKDYNAITWANAPIGTDSFKVDIPIAELQYKSDGIPYELKIKFIHTNGTIKENIYFFTFQGGVPVIDFGTKPELSKTGWVISAFSSEETSGEGATDGRAKMLIDENLNTYWHSKWTSPAAVYPHYITIDLGASKTANGLSLAQRYSVSRSVKAFEVLTSTDGTTFTSRGNFTAQNSNQPQYFSFGAAQSFRYFKVIANSSWDGAQNAALSELGLY